MRSLRRFVWFIASRLLIALLVMGVLTITLYYAMNATGIYVIIKDGMAKRAQVIMMNEPTSSLDSYFSQNWIARDDAVQEAVNGSGPYQNCSITGFDHRISLSRVWSWPWENYATATVTESIPGIDGRSATGSVPAWPTSKYTITLSKESGTWKIRNITLLERVTNEQ
ncbi:MAG: hypothetical protein J5889_03580 [Clostridia bacterium]|nr:hypothetical protein [Clostridia bacterium]